MVYLEYILWVYFIAYPVYIYFTHEQEKQMVVAHPEKLIGVYRRTMLFVWLPTTLLLGLVGTGEISLTEIGLQWHWDLPNQIALVLLTLLTAYLFFMIKKLKHSDKDQQSSIEQMATFRWFMPKTIIEARYFILGVSVTAGICEELLFRGYLLNLLDESLPTYAAVILSSLAFGAGHIYQGGIQVIKIAVMGAFMALVYLLTDSIFVAIYLHILLDMQTGVISYISFSSQQRKNQKMVEPSDSEVG